MGSPVRTSMISMRLFAFHLKMNLMSHHQSQIDVIIDRMSGHRNLERLVHDLVQYVGRHNISLILSAAALSVVTERSARGCLPPRCRSRARPRRDTRIRGLRPT